MLKSSTNQQSSNKKQEQVNKPVPVPVVKRRYWDTWYMPINCGHVVSKKPTLDDYDKWSK